jgi:hypothetical protein
LSLPLFFPLSREEEEEEEEEAWYKINTTDTTRQTQQCEHNDANG